MQTNLVFTYPSNLFVTPCGVPLTRLGTSRPFLKMCEQRKFHNTQRSTVQYTPFLSCRPVPVVRRGAGGCSLSCRWRIEPSSPSWRWPPSRTASSPSAEFSSSSRARGCGDRPAARVGGARGRLEPLIRSLFYLCVYSCTFPLFCQFILSGAHELLPVSCSISEHTCQFCWERQVGRGTARRAFLVSRLSVCLVIQPSPPPAGWMKLQHISERVTSHLLFSVEAEVKAVPKLFHFRLGHFWVICLTLCYEGTKTLL